MRSDDLNLSPLTDGCYVRNWHLEIIGKAESLLWEFFRTCLHLHFPFLCHYSYSVCHPFFFFLTITIYRTVIYELIFLFEGFSFSEPNLVGNLCPNHLPGTVFLFLVLCLLLCCMFLCYFYCQVKVHSLGKVGRVWDGKEVVKLFEWLISLFFCVCVFFLSPPPPSSFVGN